MCGIIGYTGSRKRNPFSSRACAAGISRLRQRRAGHARPASHLHLRKRAGRIAESRPPSAATSPPPAAPASATPAGPRTARANDRNAHPHVGGDGQSPSSTTASSKTTPSLKRQLQNDGVVFHSDTDTEVIAQLIARHYRRSDDLVEAVRKASAAAQRHLWPGRRQPALSRPGRRRPAGQSAGARHRRGRSISWPATRAPWSAYADRWSILQDHQLCVLTPDDWHILDQRTHAASRPRSTIIDWEPADADKGVFEHFMLKEIYEQPEALENALRGRLDDADAHRPLRRPQPRHAAAAPGRAHHPDGVRHQLSRRPGRRISLRGVRPHSGRGRVRLRVPLSQSADRPQHHRPGASRNRARRPTRWRRCASPSARGIRHWRCAMSSAAALPARPTAASICTPGPEIGVASTKAFTNQVAVLTMLALYFGRMRHLSSLQGTRMIQRTAGHARRRAADAGLPRRRSRAIAERYCHVNNFLYLGRQYLFPVALEGALKLKEISYIHAEGYPAAEMKHGPIALVDEETPSVFLMPRGADLRQGDEQPGRGQGARRPGHRHCLRGRRGGRRRGPTR